MHKLIEHYKQTELGKIPVDWDICNINEIGQIITGNTPKTKIKDNYGEFFPWATVPDLNGTKYVGKTEKMLSKKGTLKVRKIPAKSILVTCIGSIGKIGISLNEISTNQQINSIVCNKNFDNEFIYYQLLNNQNRLQSQANQVAVPIINKSSFGLFKIIKPNNFKEQQKIASILSNVDELIQKTDYIIEQTQILKTGLMQLLLTKGIGNAKFKKTELGEIPEEWSISSLGEKCRLGTGGTPSRLKPEYFNGEIPWVKTTEINFRPINSTEEHISKKAVEESSAKVYPKGSLLMAMYGQGITRGRSAILNIDAAINQACAAIQSLGEMSVIFLFYWCQFNYEKIRSISQGTHQSNLNLEYVSNIKIPCPSLKEQKTIENILSKVDSLVEHRVLQCSKLKVLKKGLMQQLLTGKIRVKV